MRFQCLNKQEVTAGSRPDGSKWDAFTTYNGVLSNGASQCGGGLTLPKGHAVLEVGKLYEVDFSPEVYKGRLRASITGLRLVQAAKA